MEEGRKRVILIAASILVARHLKHENELMGYSANPRTEALIASAIRVAERILTKIDRLEG